MATTTHNIACMDEALPSRPPQSILPPAFSASPVPSSNIPTPPATMNHSKGNACPEPPFVRRVSDYEQDHQKEGAESSLLRDVSEHSEDAIEDEGDYEPIVLVEQVPPPFQDDNSRKRRRCVSFAPYLMAQTPPTSDNSSSSAELWYSRNELFEIKQTAKRQCCRRRSIDVELALNDMYMNSAKREEGTTDALSHTAHLSDIPNFEEHRGLERWSSRPLTLSRGLTMLQVKTEVFVAQAKRSLQHQIDSDVDDDDDLAALCQQASAPSVRYAQLLGEIDAAAAVVANDDDDDDATE